MSKSTWRSCGAARDEYRRESNDATSRASAQPCVVVRTIAGAASRMLTSLSRSCRRSSGAVGEGGERHHHGADAGGGQHRRRRSPRRWGTADRRGCPCPRPARSRPRASCAERCVGVGVTESFVVADQQRRARRDAAVGSAPRRRSDRISGHGEVLPGPRSRSALPDGVRGIVSTIAMSVGIS